MTRRLWCVATIDTLIVASGVLVMAGESAAPPRLPGTVVYCALLLPVLLFAGWMAGEGTAFHQVALRLGVLAVLLMFAFSTGTRRSQLAEGYFVLSFAPVANTAGRLARQRLRKDDCNEIP